MNKLHIACCSPHTKMRYLVGPCTECGEMTPLVCTNCVAHELKAELKDAWLAIQELQQMVETLMGAPPGVGGPWYQEAETHYSFIKPK